MNKTFTLVASLLFVSFFFTCPAMAAQNPWEMKLPFQEATIDYTLTGSENGTETLYIRDYGKERARYRKTTTKVMFVTTDTNEAEITTPDWIYTIDLNAKSGTKTTNPVKFMVEEYNRLSSNEQQMVDKNAEEIGMSALQGMQGSVQQNAGEILGYNCDLVTVAGTTSYSIHGTDIPLKSDVNLMGMQFSSAATAINKGPVNGDVFTPPAGVAVEHDVQADEAARAMAKSTIDTLKSPDAKEKMQQQAASMGAARQDAGTPPAGQGGTNDQDVRKAMDAIKGLFGN
ncbi:MAG: hypothetical protein BM485_01295 [Desulfobulbaceae bacterium DB1]|nr:MAG: hypothetical protein BM485_01295 [Desulfobulbaceae bacterium DB1]